MFVDLMRRMYNTTHYLEYFFRFLSTKFVRYKLTAFGNCGGAEIARHDIARPDNSAPYRKGGHRETGQRGTRLNRSQRVEHLSAQEKIERVER